MAKTVIKQYREMNSPPLRDFAKIGLDVEGAIEGYHNSKHFMDSGLEGDSYLTVYNAHGTTIIVLQRNVCHVAESRQAGDIKIGWRPRLFRFVGEEEGIESLVKQLQTKELKLEQVD